MTVETSHGIAGELKHAIMTKFPAATVTIHIEPCDGNCNEICVSGCLLPDAQRRQISKSDGGVVL